MSAFFLASSMRKNNSFSLLGNEDAPSVSHSDKCSSKINIDVKNTKKSFSQTKSQRLQQKLIELELSKNNTNSQAIVAITTENKLLSNNNYKTDVYSSSDDDCDNQAILVSAPIARPNKRSNSSIINSSISVKTKRIHTATHKNNIISKGVSKTIPPALKSPSVMTSNTLKKSVYSDSRNLQNQDETGLSDTFF